MIGCSRSDNTLAEGIFEFENIGPSEEHVPIALFVVHKDIVATKFDLFHFTFSFLSHILFSTNLDIVP